MQCTTPKLTALVTTYFGYEDGIVDGRVIRKNRLVLSRAGMATIRGAVGTVFRGK